MKNDLENEIILKLNKYRIKGIIWHEDEIFSLLFSLNSNKVISLNLKIKVKFQWLQRESNLQPFSS